MKIFDEKGRIFGIFNIVDLCIIVFLAAAAFGAYKFLDKTIQASKPEKTYAITLEMTGMEKYFCDAIKDDKTVFDRIQNVPFGEITDIRISPSEEVNRSTITGEAKKVSVPDRYDVELDLKITTDSEIFVGKRMSVGTKDFMGAGYVIASEEIEK